MKVIMINESPHKSGNTSIALHEMEQTFEAENIETEIVQIGNKDIRGRIACCKCFSNWKCAFNDIVNDLFPKFNEADNI